MNCQMTRAVDLGGLAYGLAFAKRIAGPKQHIVLGIVESMIFTHVPATELHDRCGTQIQGG